MFGILVFLVWSGCTRMIPDPVRSPPACEISYQGDLRPEDFRGIRLSPDYALDVAGKSSPNYEEASARSAADLFSRFHELPLTKMPSCVSEAYRLTWVPSFHRTTTVRIWASEDGYFITAKRLERTAENRNGFAYTEAGRQISSANWNEIRTAIGKFDFWNLPANQNEALPNDGAAWLLEGWQNGRYHNVLRISPDSEFERSIRAFFALTGEQTEIDLYLTAGSAK